MVKRIFCTARQCGATILGRLSIAAGLVAASLALWLAPAWNGSPRALAQQPAQIRPVPGGGFLQFGRGFRGPMLDGEETSDIFLPVDREVTRQWEQAKSLLDGGHYSEAVTLLDEILERDDDFFQKPDDATKINDRKGRRSLKQEAQRLLGELPPAGQAAYELQFGAAAANLLANASGDINQLAETSRKYFHTQAGYQATLLLGRHHLDHNRPLEAALCFQRLLDCPAAAATMNPSLSVLLASSWLRAGRRDRAADVLAQLKESEPKATLRVADKTVHLFGAEGEAMAWLQSDVATPQTAGRASSADWEIVHGDAARNADSDGGTPLLSSRWEVPTANHPALEKALDAIRRQYVEQGVAKLPAMQPLAIGNLVLMRTTTGMLAVDFATGKRLWPVRASDDSPLEQLLSSSPSDGLRFDVYNNYALRERYWEDATFGSLASDGKQVYLLDGLDFPVSGLEMNGGIQFNPALRGRGVIRGPFTNDPQAPVRQVNTLSAYELRSQGKLKWQVGGQTGEDEPQLAGAFFQGPPLPLDGKLYVLAEMKTGQIIKLCALDAQTGRLEWSQQVASTESGFNILQDRPRRLAGASPSYGGGVLVCPTSSRAVVGIDIANRTLLWGFQYDRDGISGPGMMGRAGIAYNSNIMQSVLMEHWVDGNATIADDCVLVTPVESNKLFCLNLADGVKRWEQPRTENMYVAGVFQGNVLLVGKHQLTALSLADGKLAWKDGPVAYAEVAKSNSANNTDSSLPPIPSGRGYLAGSKYFLPLSSAEVICIDLKEGKIAGRTKSRQGIVPGNLVCHEGEVISQGVDNVETFFQIQPLRDRIEKRLAEQPDDSWALAHRGELALNEGRLDDALADLRRAFRADDNSYNRDLYIETMRSAISADFNKHREDLRHWEQLAKLDSELAVVLRVKAAGLLKAGEPLPALEALVQLSSLEPGPEELDRQELDPRWSVARTRWIRMRFDEVRAAIKAAEQPQIAAALQTRLEQVQQADDPLQALRQFVQCFGSAPVGEQACELLVQRLTGGDTLLEREHLLEQLEQSAHLPTKVAATIQFAKLLRDVDQPEAALIEYRRLETLVGEKPVLDGKSVQQMLTSLPADSALRMAAAAPPVWRQGAVHTEKSTIAPPTSSGLLHLTALGIDLRGDPGPFFKNVSVNYDWQRQEIFGRAGPGRKDLFLISLADPSEQRMLITDSSNRFAFVQGHLLVFCNGSKLVGLDTLKSSGMPGTRIVWQREVGDAGAMNGTLMQQQIQWGARPLQFGGDALGQSLSSTGPCTRNALCFVHGRDVTAIDPLTGSTLWIRHGVEPQSDVFGDDEVTIVAPPENLAASKPALFLKTADGTLLGERPIAAANKRWTAYGRCLLVASTGSNTVELALTDPFADRDVWKASLKVTNGLSGGIKGTIIDNDTVALLAPEGGFVMLNLADGHKLVDEKLEVEPGLQSIHVLRSPKQDILVTNRLLGAGNGVMIRPSGGRNPFPNIAVQPPIGDSSVALVTGHVYAFDRATGKPQWSGPASVEQHGLLLSQPADLPVLTFVRTLNVQRPGPNGTARGSILCLDKRDGSCICSEDNWPENMQNVGSTLQIIGDPEKQTVTLQWDRALLTLLFTDKPTGKAEPYQQGKEKIDAADGAAAPGATPTPSTDAKPEVSKPGEGQVNDKNSNEKKSNDKTIDGKTKDEKNTDDKSKDDKTKDDSPDRSH